MADELKSDRIQIVAPPSFADAIDEWRRKQPDLPSRSEAIRRLVEIALRAQSRR